MTRFWDGRIDGWTNGRSDPTPRPAFAFGDAGKNIEEGKSCCMFFCDLSNAFDRVYVA